jgi:hypothetical protein
MRLLESCKSAPELDRKIQMLYAINTMLPNSQRQKIPSLITNDFVYPALYGIEEMLLMAQ